MHKKKLNFINNLKLLQMQEFSKRLDTRGSDGDLESVTRKLDKMTNAIRVLPPPSYKIPPPREKVNLNCLYCQQMWLYDDKNWSWNRDGTYIELPITREKTFFSSRGRTQCCARWYLENNPPNSNCPVCVATSTSSTA